MFAKARGKPVMVIEMVQCLMVGVTVVVVPVGGLELPLRPYYNEVYPDAGPLTPPDADLSASRVSNMGRTTDLRQFIMQYVQDKRICSDPALRNILLAEDAADERAKVWWSRRCGGHRGRGTRLPTQSESTLIRYRRKSSNRDNPQNSLDRSRNDEKKWQTIRKLMKNKKIKCKPKKVAVPLPNPDRHHTELQPECVYIKQCSGCCNSPQLECLPIKTKTKTFPAMELTSVSSGLQFTKDQKIRMVKVEEHRECHCECKVRREHCTPSQVYNEDACQCQCPAHLSRSCPTRKVWNEKECRCECRRPQNCTTGRYFDVNSCRCAEPMFK
ncbi:Vascular endothelial growth factor A [Chionoecetes opilio]|uniref:Vascular endothelial growth factor A n=1 Tax=Chionoecetes opilio TaxID=41210 RepID=A0A8J4Y7T6_CHIOP|nr:Vascular endothelial growth factor A [Chionoecetes opilio]